MGLSCRSSKSIAVCKSTDSSPTNNGNLQIFKFKELEAATGGFAKEKLIGQDSHGYIYLGTLKDGRVVAVKKPALGRRLWHDEDAFDNEIEILTKLFSRRLVNLLGYSQDGKMKLLVVEYMENGTLHDNLHGGDERAASLSWPIRVHLVLQVARALRALHASSPPIVHRNIKSRNVFIDRHWNARLGDFGLARCVYEAEPPRRSNLSSIPEIESAEEVSTFSLACLEELDMEHDTSAHISTKTDVFAFGMLLLEMMSGRDAVSLDDDLAPFSLLEWALPLIKQVNIAAICDSRIKPPHVAAAVKHMATIAARCVRPLGSRRPSMEDVVQGLTKISKLLPLPMWGGFPAGLTLKVKDNQSKSLVVGVDKQTIRKASRLMRLPVWTGFLRLKKKRAFVLGLGAFIARKCRMGRKYARYPPKGAKVSDEAMRERSLKPAHVAEHGQLLKEKCNIVSWKPGFVSHTSAKTFTCKSSFTFRMQTDDLQERAAARGS